MEGDEHSINEHFKVDEPFVDEHTGDESKEYNDEYVIDENNQDDLNESDGISYEHKFESADDTDGTNEEIARILLDVPRIILDPPHIQFCSDEHVEVDDDLDNLEVDAPQQLGEEGERMESWCDEV